MINDDQQCDPASSDRYRKSERRPASAAALILIGISILLTLFSGIILSGSASKKEPAAALRSE